jgi:hypothetical protein
MGVWLEVDCGFLLVLYFLSYSGIPDVRFNIRTNPDILLFRVSDQRTQSLLHYCLREFAIPKEQIMVKLI